MDRDSFNDDLLNQSSDEWKNIQRKIDKEYEKKLKSVSDDAMKKLKNY